MGTTNHKHTNTDVVEPPDEEDYKKGLRKKQMVMELDMATWEVSISYSESFTTIFRAITACYQSIQY